MHNVLYHLNFKWPKYTRTSSGDQTECIRNAKLYICIWCHMIGIIRIQCVSVSADKIMFKQPGQITILIKIVTVPLHVYIYIPDSTYIAMYFKRNEILRNLKTAKKYFHESFCHINHNVSVLYQYRTIIIWLVKIIVKRIVQKNRRRIQKNTEEFGRIQNNKNTEE